MKNPETVFKELSELYEFNRRVKSYRLQEAPEAPPIKNTSVPHTPIETQPLQNPDTNPNPS